MSACGCSAQPSVNDGRERTRQVQAGCAITYEIARQTVFDCDDAARHSSQPSLHDFLAVHFGGSLVPIRDFSFWGSTRARRSLEPGCPIATLRIRQVRAQSHGKLAAGLDRGRQRAAVADADACRTGRKATTCRQNQPSPSMLGTSLPGP
jgi:hypothetical protein